MTIKTVSLNTARVLKESGFPQDTSFYWYDHELRLINKDYESSMCLAPKSDRWNYPEVDWSHYSSPTTDELLEVLPKVLNGCRLMILAFNTEYEIEYYDDSGKRFGYQLNESLPEALAMAWIFLKKRDY